MTLLPPALNNVQHTVAQVIDSRFSYLFFFLWLEKWIKWKTNVPDYEIISTFSPALIWCDCFWDAFCGVLPCASSVCFHSAILILFSADNAKKKKEKKKHSKQDRSKQHNKADYLWRSGLSMGWGSLALKFQRQWYQTFKSLRCVCDSVSPASFFWLPVTAAWTCRATTTPVTPLDSSGSMPSG